MKAKDYYAKLKQCTTKEQFYETHDRMMHDLIAEVDSLILMRHVSEEKSMDSCIREINLKYKAICRLHTKHKDTLPDNCYIKNVDLDKEIFLSLYSNVVN